jgi:hypothetical protein
LCTLLVVVAFPSCIHHHHHDGRGTTAPVVISKPGPPPHAPAHGYRHKHHQGVEMVFDAELGVYVVVGRKDHFFYKDCFYRLVNGSWEMSVRIDAGWAGIASDHLPRGLAKKRAKAKGHHKQKPQHPAKHRY